MLDLCLHEIDECRPYFVGILGERYDGVPASFSEEAASTRRNLAASSRWSPPPRRPPRGTAIPGPCNGRYSD